MGFYTPSQLIQDARRHGISVMPVDINCSDYENTLEFDQGLNRGIRLDFISVRSLLSEKARAIAAARINGNFQSIKDVIDRTSLSKSNVECLASADAFRSISGDRYQARWQAAAVLPSSEMLDVAERLQDDLLTAAPTLEQDIMDDYSSTY